jgi:NitT/TauT family transport system permease protein
MTSRYLDYLWLTLGLLAAWQVMHMIAGPDAIASPVLTLSRVFELAGTAAFWRHTGATAQAFLLGCAVAILSGLLAGVGLGLSRKAVDVADPMLGSLYSIPKITLYPIILLIFGLSFSAKVAFAALHGFFPIAIFAMNGVRKVAPVYLKVACMLRLSPWDTAMRVLVPAALPEIVAGIRIGIALTLLGTLIAEFFASTSGLGYALIRATEMHAVVDVMALTVVLFIFAILSNGALALIERRTVHGA